MMLAATPSITSRMRLEWDLDRIANDATKREEQKPPTVKQVAARRYREVSEMGASKVVILLGIGWERGGRREER